MARPLTSSPAFRSLAVLLIAALGVALMDSTAAADERLDGILHAWVAGAADVESPSLATARARFGRELSAHQLEAAVFLWTPDSVASLTEKFDWTIESSDSDESVLTGIPCDEVDRAFIGTIEVHWDAESRRPTSIQFAGGTEPITFATIRHARISEVDHVVFYQAAAESGAEAIVENVSEVRTASAVIGESVTSIDLPAQSIGVEGILDRWAGASATNGPWRIEGESFAYDSTFGVETRSYLTMRGDGAGTIEIWKNPVDVPEGTVNEQKLDSSGSPYEVRGEKQVAWVFTPDEAIFADPVARSLHRVDNSVFDGFPWYKHPLQTPNDLNLSMSVDADELEEQFIWAVTQRTEDEVWLQGTPRTDDVARNVGSVEVILDADTFLPNAIRCIQTSHESVVVIRERSAPTGLTAELILEGYADYSEAAVPQKGNGQPAANADDTQGIPQTLAIGFLYYIFLCL